MSVILILILCSLGVAALFAAAFLWSVKSGQFDDPDGNAVRILVDNAANPAPTTKTTDSHSNAPKQP